MADVSEWSNTAGGNDKAGPPDFPQEGQTRDSLNDCMRENMSAVRRLAEDGGWFDWGHSATFVSDTQFQVTGAFGGVYTVGRRVRATQTATIYGTVTAVDDNAGAGPNTDVTVAWDDGASLANEALAVAVGPSTQAAPVRGIPGELRMFGGASLPGGWLLCDGSVLNRDDYPDLFAAIGTNYNAGGETATQFRIPDLRGRSPIGAGTDGTVDSQSIGVKDGVSAVTLTSAQSGLPAHTHSLGAGNFVQDLIDTTNPITNYVLASSSSGLTSANTEQNAAQSHENQSPVQGVNFIIAF